MFALGLVGILVVASEWTICPFARLSGHPCPGCGMTRATLALLRLDWAEAVRWHPLSPICVPLVALLCAEGVASYVQQRNVAWATRLTSGRFGGWLWVGLGAALIAIWLARFFGYLGGPVDV